MANRLIIAYYIEIHSLSKELLHLVPINAGGGGGGGGGGATPSLTT